MICAKEILPSDFSFDWSGASFQEKKSGGTSIIALVAGAFMAFLILAAQYEKWSLPLSVMLALPFGTFGALAAKYARTSSGRFNFRGRAMPGVYHRVTVRG